MIDAVSITVHIVSALADQTVVLQHICIGVHCVRDVEEETSLVVCKSALLHTLTLVKQESGLALGARWNRFFDEVEAVGCSSEVSAYLFVRR